MIWRSWPRLRSQLLPHTRGKVASCGSPQPRNDSTSHCCSLHCLQVPLRRDLALPPRTCCERGTVLSPMFVVFGAFFRYLVSASVIDKLHGPPKAGTNSSSLGFHDFVFLLELSRGTYSASVGVAAVDALVRTFISFWNGSSRIRGTRACGGK